MTDFSKTALLVFGPVPLFTAILAGLWILVGYWAFGGLVGCCGWGWWAQGYAIRRGWS